MNFDKADIAVISQPEENFAAATGKSIGVPDFERARLQHADFSEALAKCGVRVVRNASSSHLTGGVAVIAGDLAVIGNFNPSRNMDAAKKAVASYLADKKFLKFVTAPGLLDARDVLQLGDKFFIQITENTNYEGAAQLGFFLTEYGFGVDVIESELDEPLSTAAVYIGNNTILVREDVAKDFAFLEYNKNVISHEERGALNSLMVNGKFLMPAGYSSLASRMRAAGFEVVETNLSEFEKTGCGIKCLALMVNEPKAQEEAIELPAPIVRKRAA